MTAWTTPRTWVADEVVTAALLNTHLRDNLDYIKTRPQEYTKANTTLFSGSATSFTDVDTTNFQADLVDFAGGLLLVNFSALIKVSAAADTAYFDITTKRNADSAVQFGGNDGIAAFVATSTNQFFNCNLTIPVFGIAAAATLQIRLQYKVDSGSTTLTIYRGNDGAGLNVHPVFGAIEI